MSPDGLEMIEKAFGIRLPEKYREFVESNSFPKERFPDVSSALINDPEELIVINSSLREKGISGRAWPPMLFCIGKVGDDYQFIDSEDSSPKVYVVSEADSFYPNRIERHLSKDDFSEFTQSWERVQRVLLMTS